MWNQAHIFIHGNCWYMFQTIPLFGVYTAHLRLIFNAIVALWGLKGVNKNKVKLKWLIFTLKTQEKSIQLKMLLLGLIDYCNMFNISEHKYVNKLEKVTYWKKGNFINRVYVPWHEHVMVPDRGRESRWSHVRDKEERPAVAVRGQQARMAGAAGQGRRYRPGTRKHRDMAGPSGKPSRDPTTTHTWGQSRWGLGCWPVLAIPEQTPRPSPAAKAGEPSTHLPPSATAHKCSREELPHVQSQGQKPGGLHARGAAAKRSYPTSEVRVGGRECQAATAQEQLRGATPRAESGRAASWETYMQVRKQQLELDMEQQTGSK